MLFRSQDVDGIGKYFRVWVLGTLLKMFNLKNPYQDMMQKLVSPNTQFEYYRPNGLNPEARYHFYNRSLKYNVKEFGDLVNTVAPVHIRQDSVAHNLIAKFVKMDGEAEDFCAYGDALMYAGVKLKQAFGGTGYNEQIRHFPDFASRMYFMEQMND